MDHNFVNYRLRYESFASFASAVNKATSNEEVLNNLLTYYKYIVNANFINLKFTTSLEAEKAFESVIYRGKQSITFYPGNPFTSTDLKYFDTQVPGEVDQPQDIVKEYPRIEKAYYLPIRNMKGIKLLIIVGLTNGKSLDESDHFFLKLVGDYLENKFYQLAIYDNLRKQHNKLKEAYEEIESKNQKIQELVDTQEKTIKERTRDLEQRNEQLVQYAFLNHHEIRGPLSSMKGLVYLIAEEDYPEELQPYVEKLIEVTNKVDDAIQKAGKVLSEHK